MSQKNKAHISIAVVTANAALAMPVCQSSVILAADNPRNDKTGKRAAQTMVKHFRSKLCPPFGPVKIEFTDGGMSDGYPEAHCGKENAV